MIYDSHERVNALKRRKKEVRCRFSATDRNRLKVSYMYLFTNTLWKKKEQFAGQFCFSNCHLRFPLSGRHKMPMRGINLVLQSVVTFPYALMDIQFSFCVRERDDMTCVT